MASDGARHVRSKDQASQKVHDLIETYCMVLQCTAPLLDPKALKHPPALRASQKPLSQHPGGPPTSVRSESRRPAAASPARRSACLGPMDIQGNTGNFGAATELSENIQICATRIEPTNGFSEGTKYPVDAMLAMELADHGVEGLVPSPKCPQDGNPLEDSFIKVNLHGQSQRVMPHMPHAPFLSLLFKELGVCLRPGDPRTSRPWRGRLVYSPNRTSPLPFDTFKNTPNLPSVANPFIIHSSSDLLPTGARFGGVPSSSRPLPSRWT